MPNTNDEIMRLILDIVGEESIETLQKSTSNYRALLEALNQSLAAGDVSAEEFAAQTKKLGAELERETRLLEGLKAARAAEAQSAREAAEAQAAAAEAAAQEAKAAETTATDVYQLADAEAVAADDAAQHAKAAQRVAEAARLAAGDVFRLADADDLAASAAEREADAETLSSAAHTKAATSARDQARAHDQLGDAAARARPKIQAVDETTNRARQGFVDVARATQDFAQGGFPAIVNNLEGVGRGFTAMLAAPTATLTSLPALLTIAGVAVLTFGSKVAEVAQKIIAEMNPAKIREFKSEVQGLKDRIKELEENPARLAIDTRDLDEAQRKLKELEAGKAAFDAAQRQQSTPEAESGKQVKEALTSAGLPEITNQLKTLFASEFTKNSDVLRDVRKEVDAARQGYARDTTTGIQVYVGKGSQVASNYEQMMIERGLKERQDIGKRAEVAAGNAIRDATEGNGPGLPAAQKRLANNLRSAGRGDVAGAVDASSTEAIAKADEEEKAFDRRMERAKTAGELRRAKAAAAKKEETAAKKAQHTAVTNALGDIAKSDSQDSFDDATVAWANAKSKDLEESFETAKAHIAKTLKARLDAKGIKTQGADEEIDDTARTLADQAFGRVGRLKSRAELAEARSGKKEIAEAVSNYKPKLKDEFDARGSAALAAGKAPGQVQDQFRREAEAALNRGGIIGPTAKAAAAKIAEELLEDLRARIAAKRADPPGPQADRSAARQVAGEAAQKKQAADEAKRKKALELEKAQQTENLARDIYRNSRQLTGQQFTPDQSREAAKASMKTMEQMGQLGQTTAGVNAAIMQAMQEIIQTQASIFAALAKQGQGFKSLAQSGRKTRVMGETRLDN